MSIAHRIAALEARTARDDGSRYVLIETGGDLTPAQAAVIVAEARARSGSHGMIIEVIRPREVMSDGVDEAP